MIPIYFSDEIRTVCPDIKSGVISCTILNSVFQEELWQEIDAETTVIREALTVDQIKQRPAIRATRAVYKALGKDPNRYRPSAEALTRRVVKGLPLYRINTAVDLINLISLKSGYSIGGFDEAKIAGELTLGVGRENEVFFGIGRGALNIAGLPVYRDRLTGVGTPTSDEERTRLEADTTHLLMIINAFSYGEELETTMDDAVKLLLRYVSADDIRTCCIG